MAVLSYGEHTVFVDNSIVVSEVALEMVLKNFPFIMIARKHANYEIEDSDDREISISPSSCRNLANNYLLQFNTVLPIHECKGAISGLNLRKLGEINLATTVHVDKVPVASEANRGVLFMNFIVIEIYVLPRQNLELAILLPNRQRFTSVERLIHSDRYEDPTPLHCQNPCSIFEAG